MNMYDCHGPGAEAVQPDTELPRSSAGAASTAPGRPDH